MPSGEMTRATIRTVETFIVALPRAVPYLGPLGDGETVNERGYFVRRGNRTIYSTHDRSVLVRITSDDGTIGFLGECRAVACLHGSRLNGQPSIRG